MSRVEQKCSRGSGNATEEMEKQTRTRADQRCVLDVAQTAKPIEKALNGMAKGTDEGEMGVSGNQDIATSYS